MHRRAAIIGAGPIGCGWAARFLLHGWDVAVYDPDMATAERLEETLAAARRAFPALCDVPLPAEGRLDVTISLRAAVEGAAYVHEAVAEDLALKHLVLTEVQSVAPTVPVGSASARFGLQDLRQGAINPATVLMVHADVPVYLLPLVEVAVDDATAPGALSDTLTACGVIGLAPVVARSGRGPLSARLGDALRQVAHASEAEGLATAAEIDRVLTLGPALLWAQDGLGGEDEVSARDGRLVGTLRAFKDRGHRAGAHLRAEDSRRRSAWDAAGHPVADGPMVLAHLTVLPSWIDYNGHMTESRYLFAASETSDALLRVIGADLDYVAAGHSYYSAETHILHRGESKLGDRLTGTVQVLSADDKRLHIFIRLWRDGDLVASLEQMLLHVDMKAGRACGAASEVLARLRPIAEAHRSLPWPDGAGRFVGQRRA